MYTYIDVDIHLQGEWQTPIRAKPNPLRVDGWMKD